MAAVFAVLCTLSVAIWLLVICQHSPVSGEAQAPQPAALSSTSQQHTARSCLEVVKLFRKRSSGKKLLCFLWAALPDCFTLCVEQGTLGF